MANEQMVEGRTDVNVEIVTMQIMVAFKLRIFFKMDSEGEKFLVFSLTERVIKRRKTRHHHMSCHLSNHNNLDVHVIS